MPATNTSGYWPVIRSPSRREVQMDVFSWSQALFLLIICNLHAHDATDAGKAASLSASPSDRAGCKPGAVVPPTRVDSSKRVMDLRAAMAKKGGLVAYIVPSGDAHQSEYVSDYDKRMGFITGFTGSAGTAVVTSTKAALWTDSRYYIQADEQMDCQWILMKMNHNPPSITEWLSANLSPGDKVGLDPRLVRAPQLEFYEKELAVARISVVASMTNLIDQIWTEGRPEIKQSHLLILGLEYAGKEWQEKLADVREKMVENTADVVVLYALDDIAWLYNLRGSDVKYTPVFLSYSIITRNESTLYIQDRAYKETDALKKHLTSSSGSVKIKDYDNFFADLATLNKEPTIKKIWIGKSSYAIWKTVDEAKRFEDYLPVAFMKSIKNSVERVGMRRAHFKDAVAKIDFFAFMEKAVQAGEYWTELSAAAKLNEFRSQQENFKGDSFETISAVGPNAAKPHYAPSNSSDRQITVNEIYLLDSGGQYLDGTTDVTRTVHFGTPTEFEKEMYTRVLMGSINMASWVWREGAHGYNFEASAHQAVWEVGLDYFHPSGHGIGMFLNIHERPPHFALRSSEPNQRYQEGMFFSDEPGYYDAGKFGIRLETIIEVVEAKTKYSLGGQQKFLRFEPISFVPFEPKLIKLDIMTREQKIWLNNFHEKCLKIVGAELVEQGRTEGYNWLKKRTQAVSLDSMDSGSRSLFANLSMVALCLVSSILLSIG